MPYFRRRHHPTDPHLHHAWILSISSSNRLIALEPTFESREKTTLEILGNRIFFVKFIKTWRVLSKTSIPSHFHPDLAILLYFPRGEIWLILSDVFWWPARTGNWAISYSRRRDVPASPPRMPHTPSSIFQALPVTLPSLCISVPTHLQDPDLHRHLPQFSLMRENSPPPPPSRRHHLVSPFRSSPLPFANYLNILKLQREINNVSNKSNNINILAKRRAA